MRIKFFIGELTVNYSKEIPLEIKFLLLIAEIWPCRAQDLQLHKAQILMVRNLLLDLQLGCANSLRRALVLPGVIKVLLQKCRGGPWQCLLVLFGFCCLQEITSLSGTDMHKLFWGIICNSLYIIYIYICNEGI